MSTALIRVAQRLGVEVLPDNDQWEFRLQIRSSSSSRLYVVARRKSDHRTWGCSCPGWKRHKYCKHLRTMGSELRELNAAT